MRALASRPGAERAPRRFAGAVGALAAPVFALPLLLDPYRWARAFGWPREPETDVGLYVGRCLGAMATAGCVQAARAARDPGSHASYFQFTETAAWLLTAVHVRGLIEGRQPLSEHAEIAMWGALAIGARRFAPA
ncbi:MAG TPA: hypothetical protein VEQ61_07100 [Thermoleophilaceae bacterium]|nr:hypothetical protein [Thermoleophilaceae bacterium]